MQPSIVDPLLLLNIIYYDNYYLALCHERNTKAEENRDKGIYCLKKSWSLSLLFAKNEYH